MSTPQLSWFAVPLSSVGDNKLKKDVVCMVYSQLDLRVGWVKQSATQHTI